MDVVSLGGNFIEHRTPSEMDVIVELRVRIDCVGCENKVKKALLKLDGVDDVEIDMEMQKATVTGWAKEEKILKTIQKIGIRVEPWIMPYDARFHDFNHFYEQHESFIYTSNRSSHSKSNGNIIHEIAHPYDYQPPSIDGSEVNHATLTMFNDDNPSGCSIM
ncbi:hypothetical protein Cgig2_028832 [Carnegiea gigantea]|uniref:HMA domain-containing protein n=1 Tax=Carnegiea gigantea TaxID=171969 RepID=A0A9Q1KNS7_9CARY|nr:hypothetical protein Cgig2_028832 [Carnegiea gigantea]